MSAYRLNGVWRYRRRGVELPNGQKITISGTPNTNTRAAAEQAETDRVALEVDRIRFPEKHAPKPEPREATTFAEFWVKQYFCTLSGDAPGTREVKASHFNNHIRPAVGGMDLGAINRRELDVLKAALMAPTKERAALSPRSTRGVLATLRHALAMAVEWGDLAALPKWPALKIEDPMWDHLTVTEAAALITAARDTRDRLLVWFALATGARAGEQMALEWQDVSLAPGAESVRFRRSRRNGITGATKSKKHRSVPLPPALADALREAKNDAGTQALVFVDSDGKQMRLHQLHRCIRRTLKRAGLRSVRWHDLRHSFASHLVAAGVPLNVVQSRLGHATITMTMRYAHLAPEHHRVFVELGFTPPSQSRAKNTETETAATGNQPSLN